MSVIFYFCLIYNKRIPSKTPAFNKSTDCRLPLFVGFPKNRTVINSNLLTLNSKTVTMKTSKFSEHQIIKALKENEQGRSVGDVSRELGIDKSTFYYWRKKYGGMEQQQLKRLKELETENNKLKQMYADVSLDNKMLKDVLSKKF